MKNILSLIQIPISLAFWCQTYESEYTNGIASCLSCTSSTDCTEERECWNQAWCKIDILCGTSELAECSPLFSPPLLSPPSFNPSPPPSFSPSQWSATQHLNCHPGFGSIDHACCSRHGYTLQIDVESCQSHCDNTVDCDGITMCLSGIGCAERCFLRHQTDLSHCKEDDIRWVSAVRLEQLTSLLPPSSTLFSPLPPSSILFSPLPPSSTLFSPLPPSSILFSPPSSSPQLSPPPSQLPSLSPPPPVSISHNEDQILKYFKEIGLPMILGIIGIVGSILSRIAIKRCTKTKRKKTKQVNNVLNDDSSEETDLPSSNEIIELERV